MNLKRRIEKMERNIVDDDSIQIIKWVVPGELVRLTHGESRWHRLPDETEDGFVGRVADIVSRTFQDIGYLWGETGGLIGGNA